MLRFLYWEHFSPCPIPPITQCCGMTSEQRTPFLLIALLWGAGLGAAGQFAKISVIFPMIQQIYPDAGASLGFVVSLISFLGIIFGLFAGLILARVSFRKLLISALILGAVLSALQSTFPALPLMLASRLIEGVSHLIIVVAAPTLIGQLTAPRHRNAAMTLWSSFFGVTFAVVAWLGIQFAANFGAHSLFIFHAVYMAVMAVLLATTLPRTPAPADVPSFGLTKILRLHLDIYRSPNKSAPAIGWLFYTLTYVSLLTVLPEFVAEESRTWIASILPLSGLVVSITAGMFLLQYFRAVTVVITGFMLSFLTVAALAIFPDAAGLLVVLVGALGLVQGASFAAIPQLNDAPADQAHANGAIAQLGNLGNTLGTPIALIALALGGFYGLLIFLALCYIAGALTHWRLGQLRGS